MMPNAFLVAKAWLLSIPGFPANSVARALPEDASSWYANGFVSLPGTMGGTGELHVPLRRPILDVRFWSQPRKAGSQKSPWNRASQLCEMAYEASFADALFVQRVLTIGGTYDDARVLTVECPQEPQELPQEESDFACFTLPMQFNWVRLP